MKWFAPGQLILTAREVVKSQDFARRADARMWGNEVPAQAYDLSTTTSGPFVVDYMADAGDGFDASFAVAASINGYCGRKSANLLVLGGDQVYPVASVENYDDRFFPPFDALPLTADRDDPHFVVAIPGNHDWYDSLSAFRRNFCEGWVDDTTIHEQTPVDFIRDVSTGIFDSATDRTAFQSRSYFAVKLPHGWWLWGIDGQLDAPIDGPQMHYFTRAAAKLQPHERVMLCTPRPSWIDGPSHLDEHYTSDRRIISWFLERLLGNGEYTDRTIDKRHQVPILISGDKHHFAHYISTAKEPTPHPLHLITCGGGGAYLSSTHHLDDELAVPWDLDIADATPYRLDRAFPDKKTSRGLRRGWWSIPSKNGLGLPVLLAVILGALAWPFLEGLHGHTAGWATFAAVGLALCGALGAFSSFGSPRHRPRMVAFAPGLIHGAAQLGIAAGLSLTLALLSRLKAPWAITGVALTATATAFLAMSLWGLALYLRLADTVGVHENELFSAIGIEDFKAHLRITITPEEGFQRGQLTVELIEIARVKEQSPTSLTVSDTTTTALLTMPAAAAVPMS